MTLLAPSTSERLTVARRDTMGCCDIAMCALTLNATLVLVRRQHAGRIAPEAHIANGSKQRGEYATPQQAKHRGIQPGTALEVLNETEHTAGHAERHGESPGPIPFCHATPPLSEIKEFIALEGATVGSNAGFELPSFSHRAEYASLWRRDTGQRQRNSSPEAALSHCNPSDLEWIILNDANDKRCVPVNSNNFVYNLERIDFVTRDPISWPISA